MENMEDSGFDSDQKLSTTGSMDTPVKSSKSGSVAYQPLRKASELQKKIENQRERSRKAKASSDAQIKSRGLVNRARLAIPSKNDPNCTSPDQQPLVMIETDDSEDEFAVSNLSTSAQKAITQQLIKDGYNLDLEPDDEDLDLIPPRPLNERPCYCCQLVTAACTIQ